MITRAWGISDYGPIESLAAIAYPVPEPGEGEMIVDVAAMALNPLDLKIIGGVMKDIMPAAMPFVPGSDIAGTVVAVGAGVTGVSPGDRVVASSWNGGLAERVLLPASAHVVPVPRGLDMGALAALPMAHLTALNILRGLGDVAGKRLAVLGATGGVGLALMQHAAKARAQVIASAKPADARLARDNGAGEVVDYSATPFTAGLRERYPEGVDILVDLVSMFDALLESAAAVCSSGVLLSTLFGPDPEAFGPGITVIYSRLKAEPGDLASVVEAYREGKLHANVGARFPFMQAREACLALRDDHVRGKIVVTMG